MKFSKSELITKFRKVQELLRLVKFLEGLISASNLFLNHDGEFIYRICHLTQGGEEAFIRDRKNDSSGPILGRENLLKIKVILLVQVFRFPRPPPEFTAKTRNDGEGD